MAKYKVYETGGKDMSKWPKPPKGFKRTEGFGGNYEPPANYQIKNAKGGVYTKMPTPLKQAEERKKFKEEAKKKYNKLMGK